MMSTETLELAPSLSLPAKERSILSHWMVLGGMAAFYLALFSYYYPCTHGIEDEVGFINQSIVWSHGAISAEGAGFERLNDFVNYKGRNIPWRNPGRSLLILPLLMWGGLSAIFVSGAVIHLLLTLTTAFTFAKLGGSPLWAALVLCHPTLALFSRAIMGDEPAALGLSCALLALVSLNRPGWWAGIAIGMAAVMRYQSGIVLPFFALAILTAPHVSRPGRQALYCLIAGGAFAVALMAYNLFLFGNLTGIVSQGSFGLHYLPSNLAFYVLSLSSFWPLMALAPAFDRSKTRYAVLAIAVPILLFTSCWYYQDRHDSWIYTLVLVPRLIIPLIPALVVSYGNWLERVFLERSLLTGLRNWVRPATVGGCVGLLALVALLFGRHDAYLRTLRSARQEIVRVVPAGSLVIANYNLEKLFGVPSPDLPAYRWKPYDSLDDHPDQAAMLRDEQRTWYVAQLPKTPGSELPAPIRECVSYYHMTRVPTEHPNLVLYKADVPANREVEKDETSSARSASKR
jgi:PAS domain-containing protein